jgi:hypothetical protein
MRLGREDQVEVGLAESVVLRALEEEADGYGIAEEGMALAPPVRRPPMRLRPSTMTEPESPLAEKAPDLELNGRMAYSLEVLVLSSSE